MVELNPALLQQAGVISSTVVQTSSAPNQFNITNLATAEDAGKEAAKQIGTMPYRIATAGYSAAPEGYEQGTTKFLKALNDELGTRSTTFITSPTADKGSIDAITSQVAGMNPDKLFYVTCDKYVKYIDPKNFPPTIDTQAYSALPKFVLPTASEYSKATAEASNAFIATGGRNATVSDFVNAIKHGNKAVVLNNQEVTQPAWDSVKSRVGNSSKYLSEQLEAFNAGKSLPYPEIEGLTADFMKQNKGALNKLVKVVNLESINPEEVLKAVKGAAQFVK